MIYGILGSVFSLIGMALSFALTKEYFGGAGGVVDAACSAFGEEGACAKVAASSYSAIRGLPVIGDVPVAVMGLVFYGILLSASILFIQRKDAEEKKLFLSTALLFSGAGIIADLVLGFISAKLVGVFCPLCVMTYGVTLALFITAYIGIKKTETKEKGGIQSIMKDGFKNFTKNISTFGTAFILLLAIGIGCGKTSSQSGGGETGSQDMTSAKIQAYESGPKVKIDTAGIPFAGDAKAPIVIVKYADFNCVHCMHTSKDLKAVLAEFSGLVKVYYKNFPLDGNCNRLVNRKDPNASSCVAATGALCADKQNKFVPFYNALYEDSERGVRHSVPTVLEIAKNQGLNMQNFQGCLNSPEIKAKIAKDVDESEKLNIQSTPSLFINDKALDSGSPDPQFLKALVRHLSKKV